ncbi:hypothetical protein GFY24_18280 [Nocardia sp. SYP-A9097]|uniref:hypothetical protein n=1 Tax=Nocardia sp. SYP-A9097 TaxID=2663237 RepID=UPI00129AAD2A|nr:hypothetical protein [Nocardia sp. SYP-A9097]MRH89372.1 hypothetical protein [Nocardia sp. SYP-A9097]
MNTAETLAAPLHPTVLDALANTPVAPLLGQPVEQILAGIGLPALPQLPALPPLPGLPVLPPLDLAALAKPITDLFSGFGDGNLNATGGLNPQTVLQNAVKAVESAMQFASQGIALLQTMQSTGARAAASSAADTQLTSAAISTQAADMHLTMGGAAGSVALGYAQLATVAARFALTTAALGPTLVTPPGQAALLASAVEAGTEAVTITTKTKAELAGHSAKMAKTGERVPSRPRTKGKIAPVTAAQHVLAGQNPAPKPAKTNSATSSQAELQQLISQLQQVVQPLLTAAKQAGQHLSANPVTTPAPVDTHPLPVLTAPVLAVSPPGGSFGGGAATDPASAQLGRWQAANIAGSMTGSIKIVEAPTAFTTVTEEALPPMTPGAGAVADGRARGTGATPEALVDARNGDELVGGELDEMTTPVIGGSVTAGPDTPFHL